MCFNKPSGVWLLNPLEWIAPESSVILNMFFYKLREDMIVCGSEYHGTDAFVRA